MHIATYLAAIVICVAIVRGIVYVLQRRKANGISQPLEKTGWGRLLSGFVSGVLFTNAVPHFVHGVSGETFPAPFGPYLGTGLPEHLANVIWGFVNMVLGYNLFVLGKVSSPGRLGKVLFFAGVLTMGIFLSVVFSHGGR